MEKTTDLTLSCRQCGKEFVFSVAEQEFYQQKGFTPPYHCKECRTNRRNQVQCSSCGGKLDKGAAVYCRACLATVHLELELETRRLQAALNEAAAKLSTVELEKLQLESAFNTKLTGLEGEKAQANQEQAKLNEAESEQARRLAETETRLSDALTENARLLQLLEHEKKATADLEERLSMVSLELEKSLKYHAALDWLEPASNNLRERLEALERTQNTLNQAILQMVLKTRGNSPLDVLRRAFGQHRKSTAPSG